MDPERWQQIDKLLEQALEQPPGNRKLFLDGACGGDEELSREVETLLKAHEREGGLLSSPALVAATEKPAGPEHSLVGQSLSHYQILSRLGEGGMGIVYKARDQHLDRFVALKVLPPGLVADPDRKRRFVQEAKAASALNHPNIITIHDISSDNGIDFIVMEYIDGKTLGQLIPRRGLKLNEALKYAIQITDALAKAHAAGIVHRDLKPGNIMVGEGGLVKVLDFGLAKLTEGPQDLEADATRTLQLTEEGMILGTASYMSPEQAAGTRLDARSDIFSFGSVLYEMVTGRLAFQGDSKMSTLAAILNLEPKSAGEIAEGAPHDLEKVITRCLRKDPSRRFQHMDDLKVALEELKEESDSRPSRSAEAEGLAQKPRRRAVARFVAITLAVVVLAARLWLRRSATVEPERSLPASAKTDGSFAVVPLTTYPGREDCPSFSPDGSQVAFAWSKTGLNDDADIYVKQIGVEEPFRLTDDPAPDLNPTWSPDGATIAFGRYVSPQRIAYLVKPQRGGPERTVAEFDIAASTMFLAMPSCAWTPNSKSLVVVGRNASRRLSALFLVSLETLEKLQLTDPPSPLRDTEPAISSDGRALVFSRATHEVQSDLYVLNLSEDTKPQGQAERLTMENPWNASASWIGAERDIVFVSGLAYGRRSLWRMSALQPAKAQRLAFAGDLVGRPAVSRQGSRLAYSNQIEDTNIWQVEDPHSSAKSQDAKKFIASTQGEIEPRFSPDGKKIAFASHRSGSMEIWVCHADGSHLVQLTSFGGASTNRPRWSPDGQLLVFYSDAKGSRDIYLIRVDGGVPKQQVTHPSTDSNPSWSADGKWIYFTSNRSGQQELWKISVEGGEAVRVKDIPGGGVVESPDGKFLYYAKGLPNQLSLWRVPANGDKESKVVDSLHHPGGHVVVDQGIYYISHPDAEGVSHIQFKDLTTGSIRTIAPIRRPVWWGLSVSPDRRNILYAQFDESGSDLMLVENFR